MKILLSSLLSIALVVSISSEAHSEKLSKKDRRRLEREVEIQRDITRDYEERLRALDRANAAARAADKAIGYGAGRVVPGGGAVYKGTREVMDAPIKRQPKHVTPFEDCQQMKTVSSVLNCGPAAPKKN